MKLISWCIELFCAVTAGYLFFKSGKIICDKSKSFMLHTQVKMEERYSIKKYLNGRYLWLRQMGVSYMLGRDISVYTFLGLRIVSGLIVAIVILSITGGIKGIGQGIVVIISVYLGSVLPTAFLKLSNNMDNSIMLEDIRLIYDTLKIQSKSGVFITDILTECYLLVQTPRLKTGLRELANEIYTKHDLQKGLMIFNSKFKNVYIDMLVMTIEQSIQSGQTVQMFQDIAQQMHEVERALYQKEKRRAENKMLVYEMAVYFAILMVVVYAMFSQLLRAFSF